jgi:SAM-dependent methyltransferase
MDWDAAAPTFDDQPDHGLRDPQVRAAWSNLLLPLLPPPPASITDLGCGTGTLAVLLAQAGHHVRGLDLSRKMLDLAKLKAAGVEVHFQQGDAATPPYPPASCDVVLARHVLWTMPDPEKTLAKWVELLRPDGILILVEGRWSTGAGLTAAECQALVRTCRNEATIQQLNDPTYWGAPITDERYLLISRR